MATNAKPTTPDPTAVTASSASSSYRLPLVGVGVPERVGNMAFWLGLVGVVAAGAVELPLAGLVGAGVVVARHGNRRRAA